MEIACAVDAVNAAADAEVWRLLGFLDDDPKLRGQSVAGIPVLGPIQAAADDGRCYIIGIASYRSRNVRERVAERLALPEERFATIVHPSAHLSRLTTIGPGSAVLQGSAVESRATIGKHVLVSPMSIVSHDVSVDDFATLALRATVCGSVRVGRHAYIGACAVVRDGVEVGEGALVGIGAVAMREVAAGTTVLGNPARPLRGGLGRAGPTEPRA